MFKARSRGHIARRIALASTLAIGMLAGGGLVAAMSFPGAALAATTSTMSFGTGGVSVKTSNGVAWVMALGWDQALSGKAASMSVILTRTDHTGGTGVELLSWLLPVTTSTLKFSSKTGSGTLDTGSQDNPVAKVDLSFKATSSKKAACTTGKETLYTGTTSGELLLVTGLKSGGTVGGTAVRFTGMSQLTVDSACVVSFDECVASTAFGSGILSGKPYAAGGNALESGKAVDVVDVATYTDLSAPKNAVRYDTAGQYASPSTYNSSTKVYSVTTSTSGLVTGSATLSGGTVTTSHSSCTYAKKSYTVTTISDFDARYASPAGNPIRAKTGLTGTVTVPAPTTGFYGIQTVKAG